MPHIGPASRAAIAAALCVLLVAGCSGRAQTGQPTAAPKAPAATSETVASLPTITAAPTAAPFPLRAGWWDNAVCYEVFVRSFYDSNGDGVGDLNGLIQKLDYINDGDPQSTRSLGATCIWLMPIMESNSYHGYDTTDYYKVEQDYGTNDDFRRLVAEAHRRGIKIVLDLVLNHTSSAHSWFQSALNDPASPYRDWYIWSRDNPGYQTPWGTEAWHASPMRDEYYYGIFSDSQPDLNYRNPAVSAEAQRISAFWLNDMGADGFRLDAIKHLIEDGTTQEHTPETHAWLRDYRTFLEQTKPDVFTIGEIFGADPPTLVPYYPDQLDDYFVFELGADIIGAANLGSASALMGAIEQTSTTLPFQRWAPFLTNHDQDRAMSLFSGDVGKARIAATALLTLPGLPFLYYGEEVGMLGSKPDEQIRTPMQWTADRATGGFTTGTPWESLQPNYQEINVASQQSDAVSLLSLYRKLTHLHIQHPALGHGSLIPLQSSNDGLAAFLRQTDDETLLVVLNFSTTEMRNVTLSLNTSPLAAKAYTLEPLLGEQVGNPLAVGVGGSIAGYAPLATLAPHSGYIFKLSP